MKTIRDLISELEKIEDKDTPVIVEDTCNFFFAEPEVFIVPVDLLHDHKEGVSFYLPVGSKYNTEMDLSTQRGYLISYRNKEMTERIPVRPFNSDPPYYPFGK